MRQNDPNRREGIGPGEEIALRKSTVEQLKVGYEFCSLRSVSNRATCMLLLY